MINTTKVLKDSLWEYDYENLNYDDEIVILRALVFGEIEDIKIISNNIGQEKIIEIFKKNINEIDAKSKNFWKLYFNLKNFKNTNISMYDKLNTPTFTRSFR